MAVWSESELDEITDEFLALMLDRREFIDRWTSSVEADIARSQVKTGNTPVVAAPVADTAKRQDTLVLTLEELTHALDASSQTFLSSADFTISHCEPEHNRDASLLFAARLQIDRIASKKVERRRSESAARRLLQLVRLFTTRISSAFQISNTSAFATSLCDMLYTFCDGSSNIVFINEQRIVSELRRAVDDFNEIVVEKLSKYAFEAQCARRNAAKPVRQQFFSPQPTRIRRPLVQIQQRSPGYLVSPDLLKRREKLARTRSVPSMWQVIPSVAPPVKRFSSRLPGSSAVVSLRERKPIPSTELRPANKPRNVLDKEQNEAALRLARKISSEVIKDLRKKYGKVDIAMLGI